VSAARLFSALLVLSCFSLFGIVRASRLRKTAEEERAFCEDIREVSQRMRLLREPLPGIAAELALCGRCRPFWEGVLRGMKDGLSFSEAAGKAEMSEIGREAKAALYELFGSVGTGELEQERARLGLCLEKLGRICEKTQDETAQKARLVLRLSLLAGAAAAILIL
jgi:hypothetical protein